MKFYGLLLVSIAAGANTTLCGNWAQTPSGTNAKCSLANGCCNSKASELNFTDSPPSCLNPTLDAATSLITQETYRFAGDGNYSVSLKIATGNSCPLDATSGTVLFSMDTQGTYELMGNNTNLGGDWTKIKYTPKKFLTGIIKNNQASFYTMGQMVGSKMLSPCMLMSEYMNNAEYGCPCNDTWAVGTERNIAPGDCPTNNGSSTCPEAFFFNRNPRFGSIKIMNITNDTMRQLDLTQPMFDQTQG